MDVGRVWMQIVVPNPICTARFTTLKYKSKYYKSVSKMLQGYYRNVTKILQMLQKYYAQACKCYEKEIYS